jgi:hypothetical protein
MAVTSPRNINLLKEFKSLKLNSSFSLTKISLLQHRALLKSQNTMGLVLCSIYLVQYLWHNVLPLEFFLPLSFPFPLLYILLFNTQFLAWIVAKIFYLLFPALLIPINLQYYQINLPEWQLWSWHICLKNIQWPYLLNEAQAWL